MAAVFYTSRCAMQRDTWTVEETMQRLTATHVREAIVQRWFVLSLAVALATAVLTLVWVGNRAVTGWQQSAALLAERRAQEKAMLLSVALDRDMKAVQGSVLARFGGRRLAFRDPYELFDLVTSAFSQYPYADSIFVWRAEKGHPAGRLFVFHRVDRPPVWAAQWQTESPFPVTLLRDPPPLLEMVDAIRAGANGEQFLLTDLRANSSTYQVGTSLFYDVAAGQHLVGAVGFLADLQWVREHYFGELMKQVESVIGEAGVRFSVLDDDRQVVATTGAPIPDSVSFERVFPLAFFDRSLLAAQSKLALTAPWSIRVDSSRFGEATGRPWAALWWLMSITAAAALVSVLLVVQSVRSHAELAAMRSDFVATVTHDLKTPLALIRVVGETIGMGRYTSDNQIDEYGRLLRAEATRLTLRIDNLLAYARAADALAAHRFDRVDLLDVIHESIHRAGARLSAFDVEVHVADAVLVAGDHAALVQVLDNLLDNAMKYSAEIRRIAISATTEDGFAVVAVADRGIGIASADRGRVFEKFFRARTGRSGSGLGLAIAQKIVTAHHGRIDLTSELGVGTTVTVRLPSIES
jgi:signal transduction histidine kinase